jgi:hypothetical protein
METLANKNAETLAIKEQNELLGFKTGGIKPLLRCSITIMNDKPSVLGSLLEREGCVSVKGVLSENVANELLRFIDEESCRCKDDVSSGKVDFDSRFGGVNCRGLDGLFGRRQDLFLPMTSAIVYKGVQEVIRCLSPLLCSTVTLDGMIHEVSSIVADPGAPRQCIHTDTIVLPCPQYPTASMEPLYTIFVALHDIEDAMGHTTFLPRTHTPQAHLLWNTDQRQKERFLESSNVVQSGLKKGDVSIFDSRVLHCGGANVSSKRRVLFYITLSKQAQWPLANGLHGSNSIRQEDKGKYRVRDFM